MKKIKKTLVLIIMTCSLFFIGASLNAQTFVKYYDFVTKTDRITHVLGETEPTNITAVFSGNDKGDILIFFNSGMSVHVDRYYKTGKIYSGLSKDNFRYRYIETRNEKKEKIIMQLFDDIGIFRVHTQDATFEYKESVN
jgi:hypothetical protein